MVKMLHFLLLSLLATAVQVRGQCTISNTVIKRSNGVFTFINAAGSIDLLRINTVGQGATLTIRCSGNEAHQTTCTRGRFVPPLPLMCTNPLTEPVLKRMPTGDPSCKAKMYSVGYEFENWLELYRACYDDEKLWVHYSEATLYPISSYPMRPGIQFKLDDIISADHERSYDPSNIYSVFVSNYGRSQDYVKNGRDTGLSRGHLTASADFLFSDQSRGTFKYVNVVPQFSSVNVGNWNAIEEWVRNQIPKSSFLKVRTGTLGVLQLLSERKDPKPAYLWKNKYNPVPKWIYKLVWNENNEFIYAFFTYGGIDYKFPLNPPPPTQYCPKQISCRDYINLPNLTGYTYCCVPAYVRNLMQN